MLWPHARMLEWEATTAEREWPVISSYVCVCVCVCLRECKLVWVSELSETNRQVSLTFFAVMAQKKNNNPHTATHTVEPFCVHFFFQLRLLLSLSLSHCRLRLFLVIVFFFAAAAALAAYAVNCLALNLDARLLIAPHSIYPLPFCHGLPHHTCMERTHSEFIAPLIIIVVLVSLAPFPLMRFYRYFCLRILEQKLFAIISLIKGGNVWKCIIRLLNYICICDFKLFKYFYVFCNKL